LCAAIIKLADLPDDDRTGADDENAVDVGTFGHDKEKIEKINFGVAINC
jgi:hypothetical protein